MAHELESMFYVSNEENERFVPWHGLGTPVQNALTSAEALEMAGLNWTVKSAPVFTESGIQIPGYIANTRDSDGKVLGIVSKKYQIVQNEEAFKFTDSLIGEGVTYETAGSLKGGKSIWLLAKMPSRQILGDDVDNYICFNNSHDGMGAIKVCATPVRVVCNNTLNLALNTAKRSWTCKHVGNIEGKLAEARETLMLANQYFDQLAIKADELANTKVSQDKVYEIVQTLFPVNTEDSDRHQKTMKTNQQNFMICYVRPDIAKFMDTAWGVVNAASDFVSHTTPQRNTSTYQERNFDKVINGHPIFDKVAEMLSVTA